MLPNTINVTPWRLALSDGIDDTRKRHLVLQHNLPYFEKDLKSTEETLKEDVDIGCTRPPELMKEDIRILTEKRDALMQEIADARSELEDED